MSKGNPCRKLILGVIFISHPKHVQMVSTAFSMSFAVAEVLWRQGSLSGEGRQAPGASPALTQSCHLVSVAVSSSGFPSILEA